MKSTEGPAASYVIIVGCGRLGAYIAQTLSSRGSSVVVIDKNPAAFSELPSEFSGFSIEGDAAEISVLRQAKASRADLFIAVTGSDSLNLMAAQVASKVLGAKRTVARVDDPDRASSFEELGIEIVSPTTVSAGRFLTQISYPKGRE